MANSLRAKLSKLRHDRHITEEEYQAFIKKLDGHDKQIRADERTKVIGMCAKVIATQLPNICTTSCPIKCEWGTDETCADYWNKYLLEQIKGTEE